MIAIIANVMSVNILKKGQRRNGIWGGGVVGVRIKHNVKETF